MPQDIDILGLIPARGGSKAIPHKNIVPLNGRPLLAYTAEAARRSGSLTRVMLSTDDPEIADAGRACGLEVPALRPEAIARDDTPMLEVLQYSLRTLEDDGYRPALVVLLQPTSPLRTAEHIDASVAMLLESGADSVVSVVPVPHQFTPGSVMRVEDGQLKPYEEGPSVLQRQNKPVLYARNGPAVLATRRSVLLDKDSLYGDDCRPFVMDEQSSVDIDGPNDLVFAEYLLAMRSSH